MLKSSTCYGLYSGKNIVGFCAVCHQPHPKNKKIKRVHRLVILPDYQGIGLETKFLDAIAKHYFKMGYDFSITTSAKNLILALNKSENWKCTQFSGNKKQRGKIPLRIGVKTASFFYCDDR